MTGPPSSSYPGQVPPPAVEISPENRREKLSFVRNFAGFVLRRPATDSGNVSSSIYELKFGRLLDRISGHFRPFFGEAWPAVWSFPAAGNYSRHPRAAGACGGAWARKMDRLEVLK
ncbi:unnamed protein product [Prunus armeniaca]